MKNAMNKEQLAYFALLGANTENYRIYMKQSGNDLGKSIKALIKYDNLSLEAMEWLTKEKIIDLKNWINAVHMFGRDSV
jgi:hypothetical protein